MRSGSETTGIQKTCFLLLHQRPTPRRAVRPTSDGEYILVGRSTGISGDAIWVLKTDSAGTVQWDSDLAASAGGVAYDVIENSSGSFVVAGNSNSDETGSDALLIEVDSRGETVWSRSFGGSYNDEARSLDLTDDGGYALGGFTWSRGAGLSDFWLVKADRLGELEWQQSFGGRASGCGPTRWFRQVMVVLPSRAGPNPSARETVSG